MIAFIQKYIRSNWFTTTFLGFALLLFGFSCVPIKKQLLFTRKDDLSLKQKQLLDANFVTPTFEYRLRAGDMLGIEVSTLTKNETDFSVLNKKPISAANVPAEGYIIHDSGFVELPLLGRVQAKGLTLNQINKVVSDKANGYFSNAITQVKLLNFKVLTMGEFRSPGVFFAEAGRLTVIDAIALSGGLTDFANLNKIKIVRKDSMQSVSVYYIDINHTDILQDPRYYLLPGDVVIAEPLRVKNFKTYFSPNLSLGLSLLSLTLLIFINLSSRGFL